jgi:phosphoribosylformimino-5-aminoimidazole carboxamide ribonucleotide (ProFAR) isomerase
VVTDSQIDHLIAAARALSPMERLRVTQRVIEGLPAEDRIRVAQDAGAAAVSTSGWRAASMLDLFADEPELVDEVCRQVYAGREAQRVSPNPPARYTL